MYRGLYTEPFYIRGLFRGKMAVETNFPHGKRRDQERQLDHKVATVSPPSLRSYRIPHER